MDPSGTGPLPARLRRQTKNAIRATRRTPTTAPTEAPTAIPTTLVPPEEELLLLGEEEEAAEAIVVMPAGLMVSELVSVAVDEIVVLVAMTWNPLTGTPKTVSISLCTVVLVGAQVSPRPDS